MFYQNYFKVLNTFAASVQIYHTKKSCMSRYLFLQLHNSLVNCAPEVFKPSNFFESALKNYIFGFWNWVFFNDLFHLK